MKNIFYIKTVRDLTNQMSFQQKQKKCKNKKFKSHYLPNFFTFYLTWDEVFLR